MENKKVLVIGSLNMDWVIQVPHMIKEGETLLGGDIMQSYGGKGANQAYAVGRLEGNIKMLGVVGCDEEGDKLIKNLDRVGIDTSAIKKVKAVKSGLAIIYLNKEGNNSIVVIPGANKFCDTTYIEENIQAIKEADIILLQMEIPQEAVYRAIELAHTYHKVIILNPAPAPQRPIKKAY